MKTDGEWRYRPTHSLISALDGGKWLASRPGHFTPRERAFGTHCIGGWMGPRGGLDAMVKRKIPRPYIHIHVNCKKGTYSPSRTFGLP
jgi:hypothetical protein